MKYSVSTDKIYNPKLRYPGGIPYDAIDISKEEVKLATRPDKIRKPNCYPFEFEDAPSENKAEAENAWVRSEMANIQINIDYHSDSNSRAVATESEWRAYRVALCDYVKSGKITSSERPQRPS